MTVTMDNLNGWLMQGDLQAEARSAAGKNARGIVWAVRPSVYPNTMAMLVTWYDRKTGEAKSTNVAL